MRSPAVRENSRAHFYITIALWVKSDRGFPNPEIVEGTSTNTTFKKEDFKTSFKKIYLLCEVFTIADILHLIMMEMGEFIIKF